MLINLSNHPSDRWSPAQRQAATAEYGEIMDIAFPAIPPAASTTEVHHLVQDTLARITEQTDLQAVHVMGEMTYVYAMVTQLQAVGIPAIASTSQRNTIDHPDGTKTVQFEFVQFRPYF